MTIHGQLSRIYRQPLNVMSLAAGLLLVNAVLAFPQNAPPSKASPSNEQSKNSTNATLPRGQKLMLKDGGFQLIREYKIEGDRVRYYSLDSLQWEQMPADLVDWDKTKSVEAEEAKHDAAAVAKVKSLEAQRQARTARY